MKGENRLTIDKKNELLSYLQSFILEKRNNLFDRLIDYRTRYITVVLEDLYQPHNASAVLRSCDCFGVQDVHIIENQNVYEVNPEIALGASKWLSLKKYNQKESNTKDCINKLKKQGYRIVATTPHERDVNLANLPLDNKTALLFGTELRGLSEEAMELADAYVKIPMYGFTESFNISVSAAICLYELSERLKKTNINWSLGEEEKIDVMLDWVRNTVKDSRKIENKFLNEMK